MEHMDMSKTGSKQPPTVEGGCPGLVRLLAQRDLTFTTGKDSPFFRSVVPVHSIPCAASNNSVTNYTKRKQQAN